MSMYYALILWSVLKPVLALFAAVYGAFWVLWVFYVAVMRLKMVRDTVGLTTPQKVFGYPALLIGLLLDLAINVFILSFILLEPPFELTVSSRLWRWSNDPNGGWRQKRCLWFRTQLLDSIDPSGIHHG